MIPAVSDHQLPGHENEPWRTLRLLLGGSPEQRGGGVGFPGEVIVLVSRCPHSQENAREPGKTGRGGSTQRLQHGARLAPGSGQVSGWVRAGAPGSGVRWEGHSRTVGRGDSRDTAAFPYQLDFPLGLQEWMPNPSRVGPEDKLHIMHRWSTPAPG